MMSDQKQKPVAYEITWWDGTKTIEKTEPRWFGGSAVSSRPIYTDEQESDGLSDGGKDE